MDYKIIRSQDILTFQEEINKAFEEGYKFYGELKIESFSSSMYFIREMIKGQKEQIEFEFNKCS
jgi:hypothetical protein